MTIVIHWYFLLKRCVLEGESSNNPGTGLFTVTMYMWFKGSFIVLQTAADTYAFSK